MPEFTDSLPDEDLSLTSGEHLTLQFGQLIVDIERHGSEWHISHLYWHAVHGQSMRQYGRVTHLRYFFDDTEQRLRIGPRLADRPVVSRPHSPITLMHRGTVRVYVSSPLYVQISIGGQQLLELPSIRLSDTWFGKRTGEGELCYSDSTRARLHNDENLATGYKVVTPISIRNMSGEPLVIDRINVPLPMLSLFRCTQNHDAYASASLTIKLGGEAEETEVEIDPDPGLKQYRLITAARKPQRKQLLHRAIDLILG